MYPYWSLIQVLPGQNKGQRLQYYPPPPPILVASSSVGHPLDPLLHVPEVGMLLNNVIMIPFHNSLILEN